MPSLAAGTTIEITAVDPQGFHVFALGSLAEVIAAHDDGSVSVIIGGRMSCSLDPKRGDAWVVRDDAQAPKMPWETDNSAAPFRTRTEIPADLAAIVGGEYYDLSMRLSPERVEEFWTAYDYVLDTDHPHPRVEEVSEAMQDVIDAWQDGNYFLFNDISSGGGEINTDFTLRTMRGCYAGQSELAMANEDRLKCLAELCSRVVAAGGSWQIVDNSGDVVAQGE